MPLEQNSGICLSSSESQNPRATEQVRLEGTTVGSPGAQSTGLCPVLGYLQWGRLHICSGQSVQCSVTAQEGNSCSCSGGKNRATHFCTQGLFCTFYSHFITYRKLSVLARPEIVVGEEGLGLSGCARAFQFGSGKIASEVSRPGRAAQGSGAREGFSEGMWHLGARVGLAVPGARLDPVPGMNF